MSDKCNVEGCNRDCFQENKQCVLHCEKHTYEIDRNNIRILTMFYDELINYIIENIRILQTFNLFDHRNGHESLKNYLKGISSSENIVEFFKKEAIVFNSIVFPSRDFRDSFDYFLVLSKLNGIHFNDCKFMAESLSISTVKVFYQNCEFQNKWDISNSSLLANVNNVLYQECLFKNNVSFFEMADKERESSLFRDCTFHQELAFENINLEKKIFNNSDYSEVNIESLRIEKCVIQEDFILNDLNSRSVLIIDTEFKSKFEMKDSHINTMFEARNANFSGLFDVQLSNFAGFECFKCVFSNVASFEQCTFSVEDRHKEYMAIFKYTTFLSFASFRNSIFNLGLDLENANLKESPNFLNIQLLSDNTNRETLRIIKNSFDKIGNHIDANDFFVKEMKKYKQELSRQGGNWQERMILWFNEKASDFGQSYIKPIVWMLFIAIFYSGLIYAQENDYLDYIHKMCPLLSSAISFGVQFFNSIAKNIIPFKSFAKEGMEFLSLIFYIIFASLTWQTIVAFKRHTKR